MKIDPELKPMMSDQEIDIIESILEEYIPQHVLEWGSGGSTIYFPSKYKFIKNWLSVEHNGNYVKFLSDKLPNNANVIWVPENEWYVDCVKHSRIYDFILIDGIHRERCLEIARDIISDDGLILLHDAGRAEYQDFIKKHNGKILIEGEKQVGNYYAHRGLAAFRK